MFYQVFLLHYSYLSFDTFTYISSQKDTKYSYLSFTDRFLLTKQHNLLPTTVDTALIFYLFRSSNVIL